jgi:hypothetical protein
MNKLTLLQSVIPVVVPLAIAVLKHFAPRLPKPWLPVLAPLLGAILDFLGTLQVGAGTVVGAALGSAGVGLREILDQLRRAGQERNEGPPTEPTRQPGTRPPPFAALLFLLAASMLLAGCKTPDEAAFKTIASLEAAVDHAMNAWADYVVWKRAAPPADEALAEQERQVKTAYTSYRLAMSAAYAARATYTADKQAGLPAWQARLDAARAAAAELMKLVDAFLVSAPLAPTPALTPNPNLNPDLNLNPNLTPLGPTRALGTLQPKD